MDTDVAGPFCTVANHVTIPTLSCPILSPSLDSCKNLPLSLPSSRLLVIILIVLPLLAISPFVFVIYLSNEYRL